MRSFVGVVRKAIFADHVTAIARMCGWGSLKRLADDGRGQVRRSCGRQVQAFLTLISPAGYTRKNGYRTNLACECVRSRHSPRPSELVLLLKTTHAHLLKLSPYGTSTVELKWQATLQSSPLLTRAATTDQVKKYLCIIIRWHCFKASFTRCYDSFCSSWGDHT